MKIKKYEVIEIEDYVLEIYKDKTWIEVWLYKKDYGVKQFCLGMANHRYYKDIINKNLIDWVDTYKELYEDED